MTLDEIHPLDVNKVHRLAEALCDVSAGRLRTVNSMTPLVSELMVCLTPACSDVGADVVLTRLLVQADHRRGSDAMAVAVLDELAAAKARLRP